MIHVMAMKCLMVPFTVLVGLPLLYILSFYEGVGVGVGVGGFVYRLHSSVHN
jgi:hypothetical protein